MPSVSAYKKAFGLINGLKLEERSSLFILKGVHIDHREVKKYSEYAFPLKLEFIGPNKKNSKSLLLRLLNEKVGSKNGQIVNSDYGNPYECSIGEPQVSEVVEKNVEEGIFIINSEGWATRRRDLPSERKSRSKSTNSRQNRPDLEVVRSRYNTSKCKECHQKISIGTEIAKQKSDMHLKGGWAHLHCI